MDEDKKANLDSGICPECGAPLCPNCGKCCNCGGCDCERCHPKEKCNCPSMDEKLKPVTGEPEIEAPINYS